MLLTMEHQNQIKLGIQSCSLCQRHSPLPPSPRWEHQRCVARGREAFWMRHSKRMKAFKRLVHPCPMLIPALMSIKPRTWIERESIYCTGSRRPALQPAPRSLPPAPSSSRHVLLLRVFPSANRRAPESRTINNALSILFIYFFCLFD